MLDELKKIPVDIIQKKGFLFMWIINSFYETAIHMLQEWGYKFVFLILIHH